MFQHLFEDAQLDFYNPMYFSCFSDEDQIGRLLRIARRSHASTIIAHVVGSYVVGFKQRCEAF
jgi:hypothetical protein